VNARNIAIFIVLAALVAAVVVLLLLPRRRPRARASESLLTGALPSASGSSGQSKAIPRLQRTKPSAIRAEPGSLQTTRQEIMRKLQVVAFVTPIITTAPLAAEHAEVAAAVRLSLATIVDKPNYAPRRPLLLPKLVQAMNDDDVSRRALAGIIASDPALAGSLLRLANSPFYRLSPEPIESLDRAVAVLGIEGMRSLIAAALMQPVFRISGAAFAQFGDVTWEHTMLAGKGAEAHAAVLENTDPFAALLLALMMGLATIIVFRVGLDEYIARALPPQASVLAGLIDSQAAIVARHVAKSWELSERIDIALADQSSSALAPKSALGRSLQFGQFIGALAVLRARDIISEDEVVAALKSAGEQADAYERMWARLVPKPPTAPE